jgi:hypothetical protein
MFEVFKTCAVYKVQQILNSYLSGVLKNNDGYGKMIHPGTVDQGFASHEFP